MSLYEYSQLCYIVETLVLSVSLLHIGNEKLRSSHWLKQAKWMVSAVLALVGAFTAIRYGYKLSTENKAIDMALNITMLYLATYLISMVFVPLAAKSHLTPMRRLLTSLVFLFCIVLAWSSVWLNQLLSQIALVISMAVYLVELVRITLVFVYNYKILDKQEHPPGSDEEARYNCLNLVMRSIILLSLFAMLHIFLVMWTEEPKAFYNFAMLFVWAYLFVQVINLIINFNPLIESNLKNAKNDNAAALPHAELTDKIDSWIESGAFCQQGITMIQMAQMFSTNRTYLSQYINARYGCSFNTWLTQLRLAEAKRLLASSPALPIDSVAKMTGFASKSHFINSFKLSENMTPGQWRLTNAGIL